jgi:hypothetical protein
VGLVSRASRRRANRWASQAALQALVRYGPEESGLLELQREAGSELSTATRQARGTAEGVVNQVNAARPDVRGIYNRAGLAQAKTATTLEGDTAALGSVADSIKAGASLEQTVGLRHLREAKADALTDLASRGVAAKEGRVWAVRKAQDDFAASMAKVLQRKVDLAREKGAFTASTMDNLMQADLDRRQQLAIANARLTQSERGSLRSAGINPDTGKPIRNGPLDPNSPLNRQRDRSGRGGGGKGRFDATKAQIGAAQDDFALARRWATRLANGGASRAAVQGVLSQGQSASEKEVQLHDPATGKPLFNRDGTPKTVTRRRGEVPQVKSGLLLQAALEMTYDGHLSRATARRLRERGIHPKQVGDVVLYRDWRRRQQQRRRRARDPRHRPEAGTGLTPGANGQMRPG